MICKCSEHGLRYQLVYKTKITRTVGLYVAVSSLISQLSCCKPSSVLADKFILWCKNGKLPWWLLAFLDSLRVSALERQVVMDSLQSIRQKARVSVRQIIQSPQQFYRIINIPCFYFFSRYLIAAFVLLGTLSTFKSYIY